MQQAKTVECGDNDSVDANNALFSHGVKNPTLQTLHIFFAWS
ncbi:MAG TPA: hypothetical protein P5084_10455 [Paludibacter sp.]|nr:hypothetical protein [Paludibacter sp.]